MNVLLLVLVFIALGLIAVLFVLIAKQDKFLKNFSGLEKRLEKIAESLKEKKIIEQISGLRKTTENIDRKANQNIKRISDFVTTNKAIVRSFVNETENFLENIRRIVGGKDLAVQISSEKPKNEVITEAEKTETSQEEKSSVEKDSSDKGVFGGGT